MPQTSITYDISTSLSGLYSLGLYAINPTACAFTLDAVNIVYVPTGNPISDNTMAADFT